MGPCGPASRHSMMLPEASKPLGRNWCPRWDSNPHEFPRRILSAVRLPFRHSGMHRLQKSMIHTVKTVMLLGARIYSTCR